MVATVIEDGTDKALGPAITAVLIFLALAAVVWWMRIFVLPSTDYEVIFALAVLLSVGVQIFMNGFFKYQQYYSTVVLPKGSRLLLESFDFATAILLFITFIMATYPDKNAFWVHVVLTIVYFAMLIGLDLAVYRASKSAQCTGNVQLSAAFRRFKIAAIRLLFLDTINIIALGSVLALCLLHAFGFFDLRVDGAQSLLCAQDATQCQLVVCPHNWPRCYRQWDPFISAFGLTREFGNYLVVRYLMAGAMAMHLIVTLAALLTDRYNLDLRAIKSALSR